MAQSGSSPSSGISTQPPATGVETARYTKEMLEGLMRIAIGQDQLVLARLLEGAAREAARLVRAG